MNKWVTIQVLNIFYRFIAIKILYWHKNKCTGQLNKIEDPNMM